MDLTKIGKSKVWNREFVDYDDILDNGILKCEEILDENKVMISIMRTGKIVEEIHSKFLLENFNLSIAQFNILEILYFSKSKNLSQNEISKRAYSSKANISTILNRMEQKGLIKRYENKQNKREKLIQITINGKKLLGKVLLIINTHKFDFLDGVDTVQVIEILKKIRNKSKLCVMSLNKKL